MTTNATHTRGPCGYHFDLVPWASGHGPCVLHAYHAGSHVPHHTHTSAGQPCPSEPDVIAQAAMQREAQARV